MLTILWTIACLAIGARVGYRYGVTKKDRAPWARFLSWFRRSKPAPAREIEHRVTKLVNKEAADMEGAATCVHGFLVGCPFCRAKEMRNEARGIWTGTPQPRKDPLEEARRLSRELEEERHRDSLLRSTIFASDTSEGGRSSGFGRDAGHNGYSGGSDSGCGGDSGSSSSCD